MAINLALEEWQHWLKGAEHSFTIYADQSPLVPLLHLISVYPVLLPGSKSTTVDFQSCIHVAEPQADSEECILPTPASWMLLTGNWIGPSLTLCGNRFPIQALCPCPPENWTNYLDTHLYCDQPPGNSAHIQSTAGQVVVDKYICRHALCCIFLYCWHPSQSAAEPCPLVSSCLHPNCPGHRSIFSLICQSPEVTPQS